MSLMHPTVSKQEVFRWEFLGVILTIHLLALAAPFTFTWEGLIALVILYYATGCLGITFCYHRLLAHKSFKVIRPIKYFTALCGTLALEGSVMWWVAGHRIHHKESDQEKDLHSPRVSFFWSHLGWLFYPHPALKTEKQIARYALDLYNDPFMLFLSRYFMPINLLFGLGLFGLGYWIGGLKSAVSMLIWGGFLRIVVVWHVTWLVNSATHVWGYRNYTTTDDSRNNWLVAALTFGEGWHNNHHADARCARAGHRWFEFDLTYGIIKTLQALGLAYSVVPVSARRLEASSVALKASPVILHASDEERCEQKTGTSI